MSCYCPCCTVFGPRKPLTVEESKQLAKQWLKDVDLSQLLEALEKERAR